jgi:hypothetical protein
VYKTIPQSEVADAFTILTVIPYDDGPEFREYTIATENVASFIEQMRSPEIWQQILTIEPDDGATPRTPEWLEDPEP